MKDTNKIFTENFCRLMKVCAIQGMIAALICGMCAAHDNHAQVLDKKVSIAVEDVSFDEALRALASTAQIEFAYSPELLNVRERVTIIATHTSVRDILKELFEPWDIRYHLHQDGVTISLKRAHARRARDVGNDRSEIISADPIGEFITLTGTVTGADKQPLVGVNIIVKGSTRGTTTDVNGGFSIEADEGDILVFSFIGFVTREVSIGKQTTLDIVLLEDVQGLGEVIINAGYWEVREKEQTGNISRMSSKEIQKQNINNPLQALQGRMTGVYIQQNTGMPGGGFDIQIRGQNSLRTGSGSTTDGNLPLYLIDGIPFTSTSLNSAQITNTNIRGGNPLSSINPNDIESIEVLKDADATAIYGSRGANGVVLITTKKSKGGKSRVQLDVSQGISQVPRFLDLLSTSQYLTMRREGINNDGSSDLLNNPSYDPYWPDLKSWDTTRTTDWQEELIGHTGHTTNANLSVSGGSNNTQFLFSGGYYRETTVFPGDDSYQRGSGKISVNHSSENGRFKFYGSANYSVSLSDIPGADLTQEAVTLAPNAPPLHDPEGNLNWADGTWTNPLSALERKYSGTIQNFVGGSNFSYELMDGLNLKSNLGFTSMVVDENTITPLKSLDPDKQAGRTGSTLIGASDMKTWIVEPQIDYKRKVLRGNLIFLVGSTFQQSVQQGKTVNAEGYTTDALIENIDAAATISIANANYYKYRYASVFSRLNYNWRDKYILNLTARRDGSSRFGSGNRFANFGAVGAAWIFSNESLVTNALPFLSFGKIRTSYGSTGSDAIGNYQFLDTYSITTYPYAGTPGLLVNRLSNPDYSWELNKKFEVALDLGFAHDRINLSTAYYQNRSTNQLVGMPLPVMTGQTSVQFNLPATVENSGWEFQFSSMNINKDILRWETTFNITIPSNRLIEFPDLEKFPAYASKYEVGKSVFIYRAFQYTGVDPITGKYTFSDLDGDGSMSTSLDIIGLNENTQAYYGGVGNNLSYRNFALSIFFQFVRQTGNSFERTFSTPGKQSNQPVQVMNRWYQEGDIASFQKFTALDPDASVNRAYSYNLFSDNALTDASFVRLKNISISWQFPDQWLQRLRIQNFRIYLQGQNLLTFSDYVGLDPENQTSASLPQLRMVTTGLQITL